MGAQRRRKMKMACTAVAFALVVLTLAGVTEAKQNTIVEMTRLRTHVGGNFANRRTNSAYSSGSTITKTTPSPTPPVTKPGATVKAVATISQTVTITSVTLSSYTGDKKLLFEGSYAVSLNIASISGGKVTYSAGCSCVSTAVAARRAGVKITFVVKVSAARQAEATSNSKALTGVKLVSNMNAVKSGVTAFASVTVPQASHVTGIAQPTVEIVVSGASSLTVSLFATIALSFGVMLR